MYYEKKNNNLSNNNKYDQNVKYLTYQGFPKTLAGNISDFLKPIVFLDKITTLF